MDEVGIILLTLFLFLLVLGPLYRPICVTYSRVKDHRRFNPKSSRVRDARRKLSTVSECTTIGPEKLDMESSLNQHDSAPECPICIGPLFVPSNIHTTGSSPMQAVPSHASGSGGGSDVPEESEGRQTHRGFGIRSVREKLAASNCNWRVMQLWDEKTGNSQGDSGDDDILTLKSCHHAFHAKCLSSWFLIERYDCPVCRSPYWQTREMRARAASAPPGAGGGHNAGIASPAPARVRGLTVERLSVPNF
ncbi:hypothetical protein CGCSCA4_v005440 [Colletotrichum siamense]|uniref:RING-type domain-containing protein n=1 Tax=Colletotrichum siamense TaxID=690259 RepID=A0A9P5EVQ3_COLSI|nr:hypothetical protein CGCSCA4_v005440 [Colletotrichum siamense]KAF4860244.1 hypothetical protein CGCSCA2_v005487 [Colletotrichum siamense]